MKKPSLFKHAAAAAALSASAIAGIGAVGVMAAGTANARPICEIVFESAANAADQYWAAVDAGNSGEAGFWKKEHSYARAELKRHKCGM